VDPQLTARWIRAAAARVDAQRVWLTDLDAAIGDGDHGINLQRGFDALVAHLEGGGLHGSGSALVSEVGGIIVGTVGGASGALHGRALARAGACLAAHPEMPSPRDAVRMAAADAADPGAEATIPMPATKGRASHLGERSIGHLDPGAASSALLLRALADAVAAG
jgi:dihydroxyacetone kinase-like protein